MNRYFSIVKADYLQRFRSYSFVITLLVSVIIAYKFVPSPDDNYTTVRIGNFTGLSNSAWIGHSTAILASIFLWLIGFYIINNGIRRDRETGVGQIIATTSISNFQYLTCKALSNFLVLSTIATIVFVMAIGLVFAKGGDYAFDAVQFVVPYLFTTLPSLFFLGAFAVLFEVLFGKRSNLMNIAFFFVFSAIIAITNTSLFADLYWIDPIGVKFLANEIQTSVPVLSTLENPGITVGIIYNENAAIEYFLFEGSNFRLPYFASRFFWVLMAFVVLKLSAIPFNRFDSKPIIAKEQLQTSAKSSAPEKQAEELKVDDLVKSEPYFGIFPLIKVEFLMLLRKGPRWFWLLNIAGFVALFFLPLDATLTIALPVFWFLQVNRWADIATKEHFFGTDAFIYSTYKPLQRLLFSQIVAAILLAIGLALPLIFRLLFAMQFLAVAQVVLGAIVLVSFAVCSGIVWGGKRFFEITYFMLTYLIVSAGGNISYIGNLTSDTSHIYFQLAFSLLLLGASFWVRHYKIKKI